jgi:hypothetical protein
VPNDLLKMCENEDGKPAIGTGNRPIKWCRDCYPKECGADFQAWKVTKVVGELEGLEGIACAKTGEAIQAGGTVWLDPAETHIQALQYAGFIEPLPATAPAKAAKTEA